MLEIKFLCDNIIVNIQNEEHIHSDKITSIIFSILGEFEELYSIDDVAMNSGIYSHINPEDNLIILNCRGIVENETFYINLYKQTYKIEGNNLDTLEVTINSEEKNSKLYEFKISIKNILKWYFKEIDIVKDDENEILCTNIYAKIHRIENLFRSTINNYILRKYGISWFKNNIIGEF